MAIIKRVNTLLKKRDWPLRILSRIGENIQHKSTRFLNFHGSYKFIDRSKGSDRLLIILAGYKDFLWPLTLDRIARFIPSDIDVCIMSSGLYSDTLAKLAESCNWSYLHTKTNKVALVQNLTIDVHKEAQWIYKLDEDIFISEGFFESLLQGYLRIKQEGFYHPGFCSPIINVNGNSYITFLKIITAAQEYKEQFGELKYAANGIKAHSDGNAAKWLWKKSLPFDEISHHIKSQPFNYTAVPHRFSIGAILFERELWKKVGGLRTGLKEGGLGLDEEHLCKDCLELSRPIIVIHNVFAGHFSFGPQEPAMKEYLQQIYPQLVLQQGEADKKESVLVH